jgi:hypothetical protein
MITVSVVVPLPKSPTLAEAAAALIHELTLQIIAGKIRDLEIIEEE